MPEQLGAAYGEINIGVGNAINNIDRLSKRVGRFDLDMERALFNVANFQQAWGLARGAVDMVGRAVGAVAGGVWDVTMQAADLEQQLADLQAVGQLTDGQLTGLKEAAMQLAINPNLKVDAVQAVAVMDMLIRNGMAYEDVMNGAAEATILLANATGADFARAADIATDAMAIFDIEAADMKQAVNGISGVVSNSKFTIDDYALALAQGGAAVAMAGVPFEGFNALLAGISSNFASGSDAGTSLKVMFQRLIPQSNEAAEAMDRLGLNFYDSNGQIKDTADIVAELNRVFEGQVTFMEPVNELTEEQAATLDRLSKRYQKLQADLYDYQYGVKGTSLSEEEYAAKIAEIQAELENTHTQMGPLIARKGEMREVTRALTDAERNYYMNLIFGTDASRAAAGAAQYTKEEYLALERAIQSNDAAAAAAIRMDTLKGDLEVLEGVIEAIRLRVGDSFRPAARAGAQALTKFFEENADLIAGFVESAAGVLDERLPVILGHLETFSRELNTALKDSESFSESLLNLFAGYDGKEIKTQFSYSIEEDASGQPILVKGKVKEVDWGDFTWSYDTSSNVTKIDWTSKVDGGGISFEYDADAGIRKVDWVGGLTKKGERGFYWTYDADAQVQEIQFAPGIKRETDFKANIVTWKFFGVRVIEDFEAEIIRVEWPEVKWSDFMPKQSFGDYLSDMWENTKEDTVNLADSLGWEWPPITERNNEWIWPPVKELADTWQWPDLPSWTWPPIAAPEWLSDIFSPPDWLNWGGSSSGNRGGSGGSGGGGGGFGGDDDYSLDPVDPSDLDGDGKPDEARTSSVGIIPSAEPIQRNGGQSPIYVNVNVERIDSGIDLVEAAELIASEIRRKV